MKKISCLIIVLLVIPIKTLLSDGVQSNTYPRGKLLEDGSSEMVNAINFLESKGYSISKIKPSFFSQEAYNMVYWEKNELGYRGYSFNEYGITYTLVYALNKPEDPNYFVFASFISENVIYWFYKVNFFLECDIERKWVDKDGSEEILKMFY